MARPTLALATLAVLGACARPAPALKVEKGCVVKLDYTLRIQGKTVDTTEGKQPLVFAEGSRQILPALEDGLLGMSVGEARTVRIPPRRAFGPVNPGAFARVLKSGFSDPKAAAVGNRLQVLINGKPYAATVAGVSGEVVLLDFNHPWAGKTLEFQTRIVDVLPQGVTGLDLPTSGTVAKPTASRGGSAAAGAPK